MNERRPNLDDQAAAIAAELGILVGKLKRKLREAAPPGDLSWPQAAVIGRLAREGSATVSDLARAENMRPQSMGPIIAALEGAGLVNGGPHPTDGRQTLLSLTDACRKWVEEGRAARQDWLTRTLEARLSPQEQDKLAEAVGLLERLVDD